MAAGAKLVGCSEGGSLSLGCRSQAGRVATPLLVMAEEFCRLQSTDKTEQPFAHHHAPAQMHGTCLGFETLAVIASNNRSILADFDAENMPTPLFPTDKAKKR